MSRVKKGFTLVELLIVIAIIGVISLMAFFLIGDPREHLYLSSAKANFRALHEALNGYVITHGTYPPDESRNIPPEVVYDLKNENWPAAPWPDSVYDWENWNEPGTGDKVYQISIRFCEWQNPDSCNFPKADWASDFLIDSSVYYCIQGNCRSHINHAEDYPGYCVNCNE